MCWEGTEGYCLLEDVGFGGVGNDVWRGVFGDGFVFAGELALLADAMP